MLFGPICEWLRLGKGSKSIAISPSQKIRAANADPPHLVSSSPEEIVAQCLCL